MRPILLLVFLMSGGGSALDMAKHGRTDSENSIRVRRGAGSCTTDQTDQDALKKHTDLHIFANDSNQAVSISWTGKSGAILALTTYYFMSSKLYRSQDYGKSFTDISPMINDVLITRNRGMLVSPVDSKYVMLVSEKFDFFDYFGSESTTNIYVTMDSGKVFKHFECPFLMDPETLIFSHFNALSVAVLSSDDNTLWTSHDLGNSWKNVADYVQQIRWDPTKEDILYYSRDPTKTMSTEGFGKALYRITAASSSTSKQVKIADHVHSFGVQGGYIFISVEYLNHNGSRVMHVSKDQGNTWDAAQIPLIRQEQFYSLLDMSEDMVFVHVDTAGEDGDGDIYTSDERGIIYSKSLDHHLYPDQESVTDFYKVECLEGVYITSQLDPKTSTIHSLITFDKGGYWQKINAPRGSQCPKSEKECYLQIHSLFSRSKGVDVPENPKSTSSAPGIIIAHGNIGDALTFKSPDVYVSNDGGYTWLQPDELKGPHYYGIGDSGGILYAVEAFTATNIVKFSVDEGQCWREYEFIGHNHSIVITGVSIEPGSRSTLLGLWGWDRDGDGEWRSVTVDFSPFLKKPCSKSDYETWTAHESNDKADDACLLGTQVTFTKKKIGSICINGKDFQNEAIHSPCKCQKNDFLCDYGYVRSVKDDCLEDVAFKNSHQDICINGTDDVIETKGYRKIPGDKCQGGFDPATNIKSLHKSCIKYNPKHTYTVAPSTESPKYTYNVAPSTSSAGNGTNSEKDVNEASSTPLISRGSNIGIIVVLSLTVVTLVCVIVFLIRRSMNFRQRYSRLVNELPTHTLASNEVNGLDTQEDSMTTNRIGTNSILYHDDSDEDLLIT